MYITLPVMDDTFLFIYNIIIQNYGFLKTAIILYLHTIENSVNE